MQWAPERWWQRKNSKQATGNVTYFTLEEHLAWYLAAGWWPAFSLEDLFCLGTTAQITVTYCAFRSVFAFTFLPTPDDLKGTHSFGTSGISVYRPMLPLNNLSSFDAWCHFWATGKLHLKTWQDVCCSPNTNRHYIPTSTYFSASYLCVTSRIFFQLMPWGWIQASWSSQTLVQWETGKCFLLRETAPFPVDRLVSVVDLPSTARVFPYKSTLICIHRKPSSE